MISSRELLDRRIPVTGRWNERIASLPTSRQLRRRSPSASRLLVRATFQTMLTTVSLFISDLVRLWSEKLTGCKLPGVVCFLFIIVFVMVVGRNSRTRSFLLLTGSPFHLYKSTDFMSSSECQRIVVRSRTNLHSNYKVGNKL